MKIKGLVHTEMVISRDEEASVAAAVICEVMKFNPSWGIEDGEVIEYETQYTSHSWEVRKVVRRATDNDVAAWSVLNAIQTWRYS